MEGASVVLNEVDDPMDLPPGFRFHPTDEEIVTHYLTRKVMDSRFSALAVAEVDMNKCEPWDLPKKSKIEEKEHYFFCQRDRKYPTGMRTNRATGRGYWKATGKDKEIYKGKNCLVGMRKTLVFYKGRAPKGEKTNWVMHEYRLEGRFSYYNFPKGAKDDWVVCRVFHKNVGLRRSPSRDLTSVDSFLDHLLDYSPSLPPLMDVPSSSTDIPSSNFSHAAEEFKGVGATTVSGKSSSDHADFCLYVSTNIPKLERQHDEQNRFFIPDSYNCPFKNSYEIATSSTNPNSIVNSPPLSMTVSNFHSNYHNQSHPFSSIKATPDQANSSNISAAIQGISDSERHCKVEPFSANNNSTVSPSQDTGISNDLAPEISTLEQNNKSFEDFEGISVDPSISDLDSLWAYY